MTPREKSPVKRRKPNVPIFRETAEERRRRALRLSDKLRKLHGHRGTALRFENPYQLLAATILSAQCTDDRVNSITPELFRKYPAPGDMARARPDELEKIIHSTGFFRQKARSLISMARSLEERFGGKVPESIEDLTALNGVGRKTAHVVRGMAFDLPALIVDTHFKRVSQRLGLTTRSDPTKIEFDVAALLPESHWTEFSNALIWHGRGPCDARKPDCPHCPVLEDCPFGQEVLRAKDR
jgi:endonuclease-3